MTPADFMELWAAAGEVCHLPAELVTIGMLFLLRKRLEKIEHRVDRLEAPTQVHMVIPATA